MDFDFSQTYLYKIHRLTTSLDTLFDQTLRTHSNIGLSQFILLISIAQHEPVSQRTVANFLTISPGAISRQVELAQQSQWITIHNDPKDRRGKILHITPIGQSKIQHGIAALEAHVFHIFKDENDQTNLMRHLDTLLLHVDTARN